MRYVNRRTSKFACLVCGKATQRHRDQSRHMRRAPRKYTKEKFEKKGDQHAQEAPYLKPATNQCTKKGSTTP